MSSTPYRYVPGLTPTFRAARRVVRLARHSGNAVYCACCDRSFSAWLGQPSEGKCPNCVSATRQKFLVHFLAELAETRTGQIETLYFAPDPGPLMWFDRSPRFDVTTTDLSAPDVDVHMDITALSKPDRSYDAIVCSHVLEHIPDDLQAMRELRRVLRDDGTLFIQVPYDRDVAETDEDPTITDRAERIRRFGQFDHVRKYGRDLITRLQSVGFDVRAVTVDETLSAADKTRFGLWNDIVFLCTPTQGA